LGFDWGWHYTRVGANAGFALQKGWGECWVGSVNGWGNLGLAAQKCLGQGGVGSAKGLGVDFGVGSTEGQG
jgi:hypothetical protein